MRIEVEEGINGCVIIKDSYDSDLKSLTHHSLSFLEQQTNKALPRTIILSDTSHNDESFYADIETAIEDGHIERMVFIGPELSKHKKKFSIRNKSFFKTSKDLLNSDFFQTLHNEAILVKVSPMFQMNEILNRLRYLVHHTVLETDFDALFHNVLYFKNKLNVNSKLMCMVKASAYGSGSIEVSRALQHIGCNYLAVAFANEGVELRQAGIKLPILVLDPTPEALERIITFHLEPEIYSFRMLNAIINHTKEQDLKNYPIHIKIDSGMHRAGFEQKDIPYLVDQLKNQSSIRIASVFSHLAGADESKFDSFTKKQIKYFDICSKQIIQNFDYKILRHILNSSGIERFSEYGFDMSRLGIGLWGISCCGKTDLKNVCTLKTSVIQVRDVPKSETVGYSRNGILAHDAKIALLPIGYADGIDRRLGNGNWSVSIHNKLFPTIGNICMDLMMVDITGTDIVEGDEVTIFGNDQTISDMAQKLQTIPYEVLTSIAPRVRRVYFRR